jgi:hypothetical protein
MMTTADAHAILKQYKENEKRNLHAENYLLLAKAFKDDVAIRDANNLIYLQKRRGYLLTGDNTKAHESCNHYFYELKRIAES